MDYILIVNNISNLRPQKIKVWYGMGAGAVRLDNGPEQQTSRDTVNELLIWLGENDEYKQTDSWFDPRGGMEGEYTFVRTHAARS